MAAALLCSSVFALTTRDTGQTLAPAQAQLGRRLNSSIVVDELNTRWNKGRPSDDWREVGVHVHIFDLDGVGESSQFAHVDLHDPLRGLWSPRIWSPGGGDRLSTSIVSRRHRHVFSCWEGKACPYGHHVPALVLKPSSAVSRRVSCMSYRDFDSYNAIYDCGEYNTVARHSPLASSCLPGCPSDDSLKWCDTPASRAASERAGCFDEYSRAPPTIMDAAKKVDTRWRAMGCCQNWHASGLREMLLAQDAFYPDERRPSGTAGSESDGGGYNELVLDMWEQPWDEEIAEIIEAVMISVDANARARAWARAAHSAIARKLNLTGSVDAPPLVSYNESDVDGRPFTLVPTWS